MYLEILILCRVDAQTFCILQVWTSVLITMETVSSCVCRAPDMMPHVPVLIISTKTNVIKYSDHRNTISRPWNNCLMWCYLQPTHITVCFLSFNKQQIKFYGLVIFSLHENEYYDISRSFLRSFQFINTDTDTALCYDYHERVNMK